MSQSSWPRGWEDCSCTNSAMIASLGSQTAVTLLGEHRRGKCFGGRWWLGKRSHVTCQFIQHFGKQLLAGGVKNEEFLEPERHVPRKSPRREIAGRESPR